MTLLIREKAITVSNIKAKHMSAIASAQQAIEDSKTTDRQKFLLLIEDIILLFLKNNVSVKEIEYWIWDFYRVDLTTQYLYGHIKKLKEKYKLDN